MQKAILKRNDEESKNSKIKKKIASIKIKYNKISCEESLNSKIDLRGKLSY